MRLLTVAVFLLAMLVLPSVAEAQVCGNGICDEGESSWCTSDCAITGFCGDGSCAAGEASWCTADCKVVGFCGDGFCDAGEKPWCTADCPVIPQTFCGDGVCSAGEDTFNCQKDCGCDEKFLDSYRCSGNSRQREKQLKDCTKQWFTFDTCPYGCQKVWESPSLPVGCISISPPPAFCSSCPAPAVVDNAPTATINVPSSATPSSQLSISVTGTDDKDVAQLLLYDGSSNLLETFDCVGIQIGCSKTFTRTAPSTFSTSYTFKARSKDSAGQFSSAFVSGTGATTAAPPVVPPVAPPLAPELVLPKPLQVVAIKFPIQPLFLRALNFPDSDCVRPGESALLAVKVQNTAGTALKDVKFTAAVPELGIGVSDGPVKLTAKGKLTRFLRLNLPEDAEEGAYYLRFTISNNKFNRAVHRSFVVDSSC